LKAGFAHPLALAAGDCQLLHRALYVRIRRLDVAGLGHSHVRMPQDPLDHLVLHPELVEVGGQFSEEGVPAVPGEAMPFSAGMIAFWARTLQVER
jgi:hypothetical protein